MPYCAEATVARLTSFNFRHDVLKCSAMCLKVSDRILATDRPSVTCCNERGQCENQRSEAATFQVPVAAIGLFVASLNTAA